jgi:hypothetical protein
MGSAINQEIGDQQRILSNLIQSKAWAISGITDAYKYNHQKLANSYNDAIAQYDMITQNKIKNIEDT